MVRCGPGAEYCRGKVGSKPLNPPAICHGKLVREDTGDPEFDAMIWRSIRPRPDYLDWKSVSRDKSRVWWEDGEGDITPGDEVYVRTLMAWSRISRGTFLPTNVREVWHKPIAWPECKVKLEFLLNGR